MARIGEADPDPLAQIQHLAVLHGIELLEGGLRVSHSVERLHCVTAGRLPFWFCHWASLSWIWAESRSMMDRSWAVRRGGDDLPWNPSLTSSGSRPEWSMWAWVTRQ